MLSYRSASRPKPAPVCPYCRQKIGPRHEVRWTGLQAKVIETLTEYGERGATTEELALVVYGDTKYHRKIVSLIYIMRGRLEGTSWEIWHPHSHFGAIIYLTKETHMLDKSKRQADAETTAAMRAAGAEVLDRLDGPLMSETLASQVFQAMVRAREPSLSKTKCAILGIMC